MRKAAETEKSHAMTVKRMQDTLEEANHAVFDLSDTFSTFSNYRWGV